jgi:hypothetical protein
LPSRWDITPSHASHARRPNWFIAAAFLFFTNEWFLQDSLHALGLSLPREVDDYLIAITLLADDGAQFMEGPHSGSIEGRDHVAGFKPGAIGGTARDDL